MWDMPFKQLVSFRDRLIQFMILRTAYYTPHGIHWLNLATSPTCWCCDQNVGDFFYILWTCPVIQVFWESTMDIISKTAQILITPCPRICPLGLAEGLSFTIVGRTLLRLLLFYARKALMLHWKKPMDPTIIYWKLLVNSQLPLIKPLTQIGVKFISLQKFG